MTVRFGNNRLGFYIAVILLSGAVLGLSAHFANIFLPSLHHDFTIFALIVPSLTIFVFLLSLQWAQPWTEAIMLSVLGILWLTMGAWSTDIIGNVQCDALSGQRVDAKTSAQPVCYEFKVIQAFSWALFCAFAIAFFILFRLVAQAQQFGRPRIWYEPIRELPWFGEMPGYYNTSPGAMPQYPGYAPGMAYPAGGIPGQMMQTPGHSIIIQPGVNGQPPTITQVPMSA